MVPLPRNGPQRSGHSASTMLGVLFKRRHPPCRGDRGGSMSFWPPPSAPWSLDPGVRRENDERDRRQTRPLSRFSDFRHAFYVSSALSLVSPAKAGAQEPRCGRCHGTDLSPAAIPTRRSSDLSKDVTLRAAETVVVRCPSGRHPVLGGPWIPAFAGKTMREIGAKPGPFRVFQTSATLSMCPPRSPSFPPRKRGPRNRGVAAATEPTSAQPLSLRDALPIFQKTSPSVPRRPWWFDVLLAATQCSVVPGSRRSPGKR